LDDGVFGIYAVLDRKRKFMSQHVLLAVSGELVSISIETQCVGDEDI